MAKSASLLAAREGKGLSSLRRELRRMLFGYTMNVGLVSGGTMINGVPESCEALVAFTVPLGSSAAELHRAVLRVLAKKAHSGITLEVLGESQSDPSYTPATAGLVKALGRAAHLATGRRPELYVRQATSDGNVFRGHGIETCHYGPAPSREFTDITSPSA